jgi:hypothetical protein
VGTGWFFDSPIQQLPVFSGVNVIGAYGAVEAPWTLPDNGYPEYIEY